MPEKIPPAPTYALASLLDGVTTIAALDTAFKRGLIDRLLCEPVPKEAIGDLLYGLLSDADVILDCGEHAQLTEYFAENFAKHAQDLEAVVSFTRSAAVDVLTKMDSLCGDLGEFMSASNTFSLFRYDQAMETSEEALSETRKWVRYVEALTRFELPLLQPLLDLGKTTRVLEIGGNTGLFLEAILDQDESMVGHVLDLPAVCALGRQRNEAETRLSFFASDALSADWQALAGSHDAVVFKSMLHDWPDREAKWLLQKAVTHLTEGAAQGRGCIMIVERGSWDDEIGQRTAGHNLANLVFAPFYRQPERYISWLEDLGCEVEVSSIMIDMKFHIIKARPKGPVSVRPGQDAGTAC